MTKECNELGEMERVNLSLHTSSALFTFLSSDSWGEARPFGPPVPGHDGRTMRGTESGAYDPRFPAFHLLTSSSLLLSGPFHGRRPPEGEWNGPVWRRRDPRETKGARGT